MLHFRSSEQGPIKLIRRLINCVTESVSSDKELVKELKRLAERLKAADKHPEDELQAEQANLILGMCFFYIFHLPVLWFLVRFNY